MSIFSRRLGYVPRGERRGIRLEDTEPWRITPTQDVSRFIRALPLLVPEDSIAYFEDTGESHVAEYLRRVSIHAPGAKIAVGAIWPRPDRYHVPLTVNTMEAPATFLDDRPAGLFCSHCHVYREGTVVLQWHEAFSDDPLYVSRAVDEAMVRRFAEALGSTLSSGRCAG